LRRYLLASANFILLKFDELFYKFFYQISIKF